MINSEKVKILLEERIKLLPDEPKVNRIWEELIEIFSKNKKETNEYLAMASRKQIEWISEVFEDISENLQSKEFISLLKELEKKFSDLDLSVDILYAEKALKK
ncbi:hypothetical protein [Enterococcus sp. LJL51]|uniref:hypothetical protein n=1 Tax=Enterococcus sp. LJL51 TaxID=3416656 RepID=UPI003CF5A693